MSTPIEQNTTELEDLYQQVLNLPDGSPSSVSETILSYVIEEAESTIAKVFSHGNYGRTIRFIAISDTHEDSAKSYNAQITVSNQHAGQAIKYISDRIGLDFVAHLGDASSRGAWTTTQEFDVLLDDVMNINKFIFSGVRNTNTVFVAGNHDMMNLSGNQLLNSGASVLFGSMCSGTKDRCGGWGYFDIEDAKVRVIYLNTSDSPTSATYLGLTDAQKNWLCETLIDVNTKDDADEWGIILLSHAPLDFGGANISTDILLPYVNGGTYGTHNFSNKNKAQILCNIHGHVHCYSYGYMAGKIRRFAIPNACFLGNNHYKDKTEYADWADTSTYNKTANSGQDTSFSLVTIDLDNDRCYVDNYGAGIDRNFKTEYNSGVSATSISNITYNGSKTEGSTIDKSKFSFTVAYNNGTTETVTGATTVSPATISLGNNSVTITYVEDGATLTGSITIVGEAKPVVNLFNKNDSDVVIGGRVNSSHNTVYYRDNQLVTGYIEAEVGDVFTVKTDRSNDVSDNAYIGAAYCWDEDKNFVGASMERITTKWEWNDDYTEGTFTIPSEYRLNSSDLRSFEGTAFIRFCVAYDNIDNIVITKG